MHLYELFLSLDRALFLLLNASLVNPLFDFIFTKGTEAGFWIVPGIAAAALFIFKKRKEALVVLGLALITVAITDPLAARVLKPLFGRFRPCHPDYFVEGGRFLCGMRHSFSFPSVHAVNIFAQATLLTFFYPRWKWAYILFACFIGYSRIYVGVHYPADIVAGALFGIAVAIGVVSIYSIVLRRIKKRWLNERQESEERNHAAEVKE